VLALLLSVAHALTVDIQVHGGADRVEVTWLGEVQETEGDSAQFEGEPVRFLPVRIQAGALSYEAIEVLPAGDVTLHYGLNERGIRRLSGPGGETAVASRERRGVWFSAAMSLVALLAVVGVSRGRPREYAWPRALSPLLWLVLGVAWTWPAVLGAPTGLHFDGLGTLWSIDAASRLLPGLTDPLTGYPAGADYSAFDSYLMLPLAALFGGLGAARVHGLLAVLGVAGSAWAAEAFARAVGAKGPFALLAGFAFAFSGIAANALLEGHVYHVVDPWLPLFGWAWWRATSEGGTWKHAVLAGLAFDAALLTTGYLGVACALMAVGFWLGGRKKPGLWALPVVAPVLLGVGWLVSAASPEVTEASLRVGSASLRALFAPGAELDRAEHSMALALDGVVLALLLLGKGPARLRWTALVALGIAFFGLPTDLVRFPARMAWTFGLCGGVYAAVAAGQLGRGAIALVPASALWSFVVVALPWRQQGLVAAAPMLQGPTLELLPRDLNPNGDLDVWLSASACYAQTLHGQPLAEDCVTVPVTANPRARLNEELTTALHGGGWPDLSAYDTLVTRPDLLREGDRERLLARLGPPSTSTDGAEHLWSWSLPLRPLEAASSASSLRVLAPDDTPRSLTRDGSVVAELRFQPAGLYYEARVSGPLTGALALDGHPVLLAGDDELVLTDEGTPLIAAPFTFSPPANEGVDRAALVGTGAWVLLAAGCLVARRKL
jgi:hypothetical protein